MHVFPPSHRAALLALALGCRAAVAAAACASYDAGDRAVPGLLCARLVDYDFEAADGGAKAALNAAAISKVAGGQGGANASSRAWLLVRRGCHEAAKRYACA